MYEYIYSEIRSMYVRVHCETKFTSMYPGSSSGRSKSKLKVIEGERERVAVLLSTDS